MMLDNPGGALAALNRLAAGRTGGASPPPEPGTGVAPTFDPDCLRRSVTWGTIGTPGGFWCTGPNAAPEPVDPYGLCKWKCVGRLWQPQGPMGGRCACQPHCPDGTSPVWGELLCRCDAEGFAWSESSGRCECTETWDNCLKQDKLLDVINCVCVDPYEPTPIDRDESRMPHVIHEEGSPVNIVNPEVFGKPGSLECAECEATDGAAGHEKAQACVLSPNCA